MKKLLIVVDFQNDFINGSLGFEEALNIKDLVITKIKDYRKNGHDIIFTLDTHDEDYLKTEEGINLPVKHCLKNTYGHELHPDILKLKNDDDLTFEKNTFPSLALGKYLENKTYQIVELCGLVSNICVLSNAVIVKSALPNAHLIVDALATESFDKTLHKMTFDILEGLQVEVINK